MEKSFFSSVMYNQDGTKYGMAYFFFPKTAGYSVGNPNDFREPTNDIWNQILVKEFDSLEAALKYDSVYQEDVVQ